MHLNVYVKQKQIRVWTSEYGENDKIRIKIVIITVIINIYLMVYIGKKTTKNFKKIRIAVYLIVFCMQEGWA